MNNNKSVFIILILSIGILGSNLVYANSEIYYEGMHFHKAWFKIDGKRVKLKPGQISKDGVHLVSANEDEVIIRVNGSKYLFKKGSKKGILYQEEIKIYRDSSNGSYMARGYINNQPVNFLVDTGATLVTLSAKLARDLNIRRGNEQVKVQTASKEETAYYISLDSVRVGGIELKNVPALITRHDKPVVPLLGMSFLEKVEISQADNKMILRYTGE